MSIALRLLLISIAIVPILALSDGVVARSLFATLAAVTLAVVVMSARAADIDFTAQATRHLKLAAALPAIWMIVQVLPMPFSSMSHSIWVNAGEALNQRLWGHISVDIGATIEASAFYLANISLIVVGIFVARDRRRAELLLFALTAISLLTVVTLLTAKSGLIASLVPREMDEALSGLSALGVILSLTSAVHAFERYQSKRTDTDPPKQNIQKALALWGVGLMVCIAGLVAGATVNVGLTVAFGATVFGSIQAIRRIGLAGWVSGIFISAMVTAGAMIVLWRYNSASGLSPFLQFATSSPSDAISITRRILSDTGWAGIGAGAYVLMLPIYQELGALVTKAPSTAAALAIELGRPMALLAVAVAIGLAVIFFRGAVVRGRGFLLFGRCCGLCHHRSWPGFLRHQPVTFLCCYRRRPRGRPWPGTKQEPSRWCVTFEFRKDKKQPSYAYTLRPPSVAQ